MTLTPHEFIRRFLMHVLSEAGGPTRAGGSCRPIFSTVTAAWRGGQANY